MEALPALVAVEVDWTLVGCLRNIEPGTPSQQVKITVHGFDADTADSHAYALARDVLPCSHWRSVAFKEDEFWKLPGKVLSFEGDGAHTQFRSSGWATIAEKSSSSRDGRGV